MSSQGHIPVFLVNQARLRLSMAYGSTADAFTMLSLLPYSAQHIAWVLPFCANISYYILCCALITYTHSHSIWRWFSLPVLILLSCLQVISLSLLPINRVWTACLGVEAFLHTLHAMNLLVVLKIDASDIEQIPPSRKNPTIVRNISGALYLLFSVRGIGTKWQAKNTPPALTFDDVSKTSRNAQFCIRHSLIAIWQLLTVALTIPWLQKIVPPKSTCDHILPSIVDSLGLNIAIWPMIWVFFARLLIDSSYRLASVGFVATGISTPESWPPAFNSMLDAWTLRRFWGRYWHQMLRWPCSSVAAVVTQRVFGLSKPSLAERYLHVLCVFTLSGILHLIHDTSIGVQWRESGAVLFFTSFTLGFMIEDCIQGAWNRLTAKEPTEKSPPSLEGAVTPQWQKVLGYLWVWAWLSVTTPIYIQPLFQCVCRSDIASDFLRFIPEVDQLVGLLGIGAGGLLIWSTFGIAV